jgi:hypothetical protein
MDSRRAHQATESNSAIIASTLNSSRPTGSFGSWIDPPMFSFTPASVSSATMSRTSGRERARRSSLVTTRVSPDRQAASASRGPGRGGWCRSGRDRRRSRSA